MGGNNQPKASVQPEISASDSLGHQSTSSLPSAAETITTEQPEVQTLPRETAQDLGKASLSSVGDLSDEELAQLFQEEDEWEREHPEEAAEMDAEFARWEASKKLKPFFADGVQDLLEGYDAEKMYSFSFDNFLIDGEILPQLVELTNHPDEAMDFRFEMEDIVNKHLENEKGGPLDPEEDKSPYEVIDQILSITLKRAAEEYQADNLSREEFDLSCQVINNLGLEIPLKFNHFTAKEFNGVSAFDYRERKWLEQLGIINQAFIDQLHQASIDELFKETEIPIPENLQHLPADSMQHWAELSDKIGCDAFLLYTQTILDGIRKTRYIQHRTQRNTPPITPAIYFDEQILPTPIAFAGRSAIMSQLYSGHSFQKERIANLVQEFSNRLAPTDRFFYETFSKINPKDKSLRDGLASYISTFASGSDYRDAAFTVQDGVATPTEYFWQKIGQYNNLKLIQVFDGYEDHCSPSRIAAAKLPEQTRNHLQVYLADVLDNQKDESQVTRIDLINSIITGSGELQPQFLNSDVLGHLKAEELIKDFPKQLPNYFSKTELNYLDLPRDFRSMLQDYATSIADQPDYSYSKLIQQYVDEAGPTDELFQLTFTQGRYDLIGNQTLRRWRDLPFSNNQRYVLQNYKDLVLNNRHNGLKLGTEYAKAISLVDIENLTYQQIDSITDIVNRVSVSNAVELRRAGVNFLQEIIGSDDSFTKLDQIEQVFLHSNLPYAGKVFRSFQVLYPAEKAFENEFHNATHRGVLENLPNTGIISRESVLFADLVKASIGSNNRSMKNYIKNLRQGQDLSERILQDETTYEELTDTEKFVLDTYLKHLETLYDNTARGRNEEDKYVKSTDLKQNLTELAERFNANERHQLPDRVVRSFCYMLGIHNLDELENYMQNAVITADARGRERFATNNFTLEENDLVKAIGTEYLGQILQNGSICKEFLNGAATSDATPLDTDLTRLGAECTGDISQALDWKNANAAFTACRVNLVIKNSDLLQTNGEKYDPSKLELFDNFDSNWGIRTGFPSSAIDFIVFDGSNETGDYTTDHSQLPYVCTEIAKNGFYIPVVDKVTGKCVFSPTDYDELRRKLSGLEYYDAPEFAFASDEDLFTPGIEAIINSIANQDNLVATQRAAVEATIEDNLWRNIHNFHGLKTAPDGDLTPGFVELIDTGSTGRGTSVPGDKIDFDFIMRIDASIYNQPESRRFFEDTLRQSLNYTADNSNYNGIRLDGVQIHGLENPVKLDISFVQRTNHMEYSTDQAVADRLNTIRQQSPERYSAVIANIILGKQLLKSADAYKPYHSGDEDDPRKKGGLGGVGIENWILQNGGSLKAAAESFLAAADQANHYFKPFCQIYQIWDAGQNHFTVRDNESSTERQDADQKIPYDNFVTRNMDAGGFARMTVALQNYLANIT